MEPALMVRNFAMSIATGALVGVAFGWAAWQARRRWGGRSVLAWWAVATFALSFVMADHALSTMADRGWSIEQQQRMPIFRWLLTLWGVSLGFVALAAHRRLRAGVEQYTGGVALRTAGAWLFGAVVWFVVFALVDFAGLL